MLGEAILKGWVRRGAGDLVQRGDKRLEWRKTEKRPRILGHGGAAVVPLAGLGHAEWGKVGKCRAHRS